VEAMEFIRLAAMEVLEVMVVWAEKLRGHLM
jgi:hypothetical protein